MGVTVADTISVNGLSVSNFIISIKGIIRSIMKMKVYIPNPENPESLPTTIYRINYACQYYANQNAYNADLMFHHTIHNIDLSQEDIVGCDIFAEVYADIKSRYQTVTDC